MKDDPDDKLRSHLDRTIEKRVKGGMTLRERARLGRTNDVKEERQSWGVRLVEGLFRDSTYALRALRRSPGFTAAVALSLSLGIGANTAIFTLMDAALWRMLPVREPESLLVVGRQEGTEFQPGFHYEEYRFLRENSDVVDVAGYSDAIFNVTIDGNAEPAIEGQLVSGSYFNLLGVNPVVGRAIALEDDRVPSGHPVAMISHGYWRRRFARNPDVIGRTIRIFDTSFTVIGVTPPGFFGAEIGKSPKVFVPLMMQPVVMPSFENFLANPVIFRMWVQTIARVKPGVGRRQALDLLNSRLTHDGELLALERNYGYNPTAQNLTFIPATGVSELRRQFSRPLFILMVVVALVLLIACANTANLLLARAASRQPEFSIRLALGARRGRLVCQLLVESMILAVLGGVGGVLMAGWATQLLVAYISVGRTPIVLDLSPNPKILLFTLAVSVSTAVVFGLAPSLRASRIRLARSLRSLGGATDGLERLGPQRTLAAVQISLSLILMVGAGLFVRSLLKLSGEDHGVSRDQVLIARVEPQGSDQRRIPGTTVRLDRIYRRIMQNVAAIPGVRSASMAQGSPTAPTGHWGYSRLGVLTPSGEELTVPLLKVYPHYFETVGVQLVAGRDFSTQDLSENASAVCIVNETFVQKVFPEENPIGKPCVVTRRQESRISEPFSIVGVVRDSRYTNPQGNTQPVIYMTFLQTPTGRGQMVLHVRADGGVGALLPTIRKEVARADPSTPMIEAHTLDEEMDAALVQQRLVALLITLFGGLALLLACVGIYGLLVFSVTQRTGEIGIRVALGAQRRSVEWLVMREALTLVGIGLAIGLPAALIMARLVSSQIAGLLFGLEATDPLTITVATMLLVIVAALASYLPARRASSIEPITALRSQ